MRSSGGRGRRPGGRPCRGQGLEQLVDQQARCSPPPRLLTANLPLRTGLRRPPSLEPCKQAHVATVATRHSRASGRARRAAATAVSHPCHDQPGTPDALEIRRKKTRSFQRVREVELAGLEAGDLPGLRREICGHHGLLKAMRGLVKVMGVLTVRRHGRMRGCARYVRTAYWPP